MPGKTTSMRGGDNKKRGQNHQNKYKYKPTAATKVPTPAQAKAKEAPLDFLCQRCHDTIKWRVDFDKYKPLTAPRKCRICVKPVVIKAYRVMCDACAVKDKKAGVCLCTKCGYNVITMQNASGLNAYATPGQVSKTEEQKLAAEEAAVEAALEAMKLRERRQVERKLNAGEIRYNAKKKCFVQCENESVDFELEGDGDSSGEESGEDNSDGSGNEGKDLKKVKGKSRPGEESKAKEEDKKEEGKDEDSDDGSQSDAGESAENEQVEGELGEDQTQDQSAKKEANEEAKVPGKGGLESQGSSENYQDQTQQAKELSEAKGVNIFQAVGAMISDSREQANQKLKEYQKGEIGVADTLGNKYKSLEELWEKELSTDYADKEKKNPGLKQKYKGARVGGRDKWYGLGLEHWNKQEATIDGVTGGYGANHQEEADYSK